jgi:hypothetical protein
MGEVRLMIVVKGENTRSGWKGEAVFSKCGLFRYSLLRRWNDARNTKLINFVMLNPSTADAMKNDPTVERCCRRAQTLGYDQLIVTNVFALRSTDPVALYAAVDAVGPRNDAFIRDVAEKADVVVCAWGNHGVHLGRGDAVNRLLILNAKKKVYRLGALTQENQPRHPLHVSYRERLVAHDTTSLRARMKR